MNNYRDAENAPGSFFMPKIKSVTTETLVAFSDLIDKLERAWYPALPFDSEVFYPYTPWPVSDFIINFELAQKNTLGNKFLEVGCGIGIKLILVSKFSFDVTGIDIRESYLPVAKYFCPEANIQVCDARKFQTYGQFDLIYSYRPMIKDEDQLQLECYQTSQMKSGALIISPDRPLGAFGMEYIGQQVWRKI